MQLAVAGSEPAYLPWKFREANAELDDLALEIAAAHGDARLPLIERAAAIALGHAERGLLDKGEVADVLHCAAVQCGATRDYGQDAVQVALAAGAHEAQIDRRREIGSGLRYQSRCLADVVPVPIKWLWFNRMALGKINIVAGNPGVSKSTLLITLAAAVTTGGKLPDGMRAPLGSVILITCEDDAGDTIRPRLEAAGADLSRVYLLDWIVNDGQQQHFDIGAHRDGLEEMIKAIGDVALIVIDPITAYCGGADSHKTADVRQALAPLQDLAASTSVAIVAISHLNKNGSEASAMARVIGSGAFVAVARSAWLVAEDPCDDDRRRRILTPLKNNLGDDRTGFAFSVEAVTLPSGIATSRVVFEREPVAVTADDLLHSQAQTPEDRGAEADAVEFLADMLRDGPRRSKEVEKEARAAGHSPRTLDRARRALGVKARKVEGIWKMSLPESKDAKDAKDARNLGTADLASLAA